jgi:hypothetical protein
VGFHGLRTPESLTEARQTFVSVHANPEKVRVLFNPQSFNAGDLHGKVFKMA